MLDVVSIFFLLKVSYDFEFLVFSVFQIASVPDFFLHLIFSMCMFFVLNLKNRSVTTTRDAD